MSEIVLAEESAQLPLTKKGQKTRQKLLQAAEEIFGTQGYFNASVVDITQKANVAQGTFYNYFSSKQMIFEELIKQLSSDFRKEIRMEAAKATNAREAQLIGFRTFFKWVKNHRNLYSIVQQAVLVDEQLYRWYYDRLASGYVKGLQEAMANGEFKELDPETVAYCLMGISQFIGMRWVYWEDQEVPERVLEDMASLIFGGLSKTSKP
ncbi:TetR/AcrR family transcriptional regulator [Effusibacillus lacus]|uniref:TetR family transcriptional regulator n=1 Tax=Effusibacillus lacus TaxID=1348429 RepID=A0A292YKJ7_9BACL|nr:TetR/AcrR family transcriptional regulator [Effusibacillus lacus]TCS73668.1 TetR family transcriptional regulator [Effusibacillus lacus]GAX89441.1 TetR family transcriptional regulator [Effusibacillus lacus]